jgi:hypothetical protein
MADDENIKMRDKGYYDGHQGVEARHTSSQPYMDGYNLGSMVRTSELANQLLEYLNERYPSGRVDE